MKFSKLFKPLWVFVILFFINLSFFSNVYSQDLILFVSDRDEPVNWDIYSMNVDGTGIARLTDSPSIDNHPNLSPDGTTVVFSSNLSGNFENYKAPLGTLADETTWVQLTTFGCANTDSPNRCTPARHPEWSPDGAEIIYTAKDGCCPTTEIITSQCSVPVQHVDPCGEHFEQIHIMNADGTNDRVIDTVTLQGGSCGTPTVFHAGHPQFHPNGDKIIFSGATNRDGTDWEVFIVDWDGTLASNLQQVTQGTAYPPNPANPIQMTGGARFSCDGENIYYSSTRTWKGNSQLFAVRGWASQTLPLPVSDDLRLTWHCGNDYVPEQSCPNGALIYTSDAKEPWDNPTDLDMWKINTDGSGRSNLTANPDAVEESLIADEVSWFCGLPRNLSPCVFIPRAVSIESKFLMANSNSLLPPSFPNRGLYQTYINALTNYLELNHPAYLTQIQGWLLQFQNDADDDLDGLTNEDPLDGIDNDGDGNTDEDPPSTNEIGIATLQIVVPSFMPPPTDPLDPWCPDCVPCDECVQIQTTSPLPNAVFNQPYSLTLKANKTVQWDTIVDRLPAGLDLDTNTGEISGIPTEIVSLSLVGVVAIDVNGNGDSKDFSLTVKISDSECTDTNYAKGNSFVKFNHKKTSRDSATLRMCVDQASCDAIEANPAAAEIVLTLNDCDPIIISGLTPNASGTKFRAKSTTYKLEVNCKKNQLKLRLKKSDLKDCVSSPVKLCASTAGGPCNCVEEIFKEKRDKKERLKKLSLRKNKTTGTCSP